MKTFDNKARRGLMTLMFAILSLLYSNDLSAQNVDVKGTVTDAEGPIIGATVVDGKGTGVMTDVKGEFLIKTKMGEILTVSFVGYEPKKVTVDSKTINIKLESSNNVINDVQVVAFGKQKKESVVGSVTTVRPSELRVPSSNLTTALGGRIAGLISMQTSGEPGADNAQFFVRGVATFNEYSRGPLILIDNMELTSNDLARLSVDDIASFSIMKDATATALYGSRGANGVILVTTKEGRDGVTGLNIRFENSFSKPTRSVEFADPLTYMKLNNEAIVTRNPLYNRRYSDEQIAGVESGSNPYYYPANDWRSLLFKDMASNQRLNVSLSGGGKKARFYIAGALNNDNGILKTDTRNNFNNNINIKNINLRSNTNLKLTPTTDAAVRFNANFRSSHGPMFSGNQMYQRIMMSNPVDFPAYYLPDEANLHTQHILFGGTPEYDFINPYADMVRGYQEGNQTNLVAQIELMQNLDFFTKGLSARFMGSTTRESAYSINRSYRPYYYTMSTYNPSTGYFKLNNFSEGDEALGFDGGGDRRILSTIYGEFAVNYDREFNEKHNVSGMLVGTLREIITSDFGNDLQRSLPTRNIGLSGRFTYGYDHRYFVEANFGYNGAERFAKKNRFGFFPSFGTGWVVSNEKFWTENKYVDKLKLKATYGIVGNDAIGDERDRFFYLSRVRKDKPLNNNFGEGIGSPTSNSAGIIIDRFANNDITWEKAAKLNLGFEATLFNDLEIQFDYFTERRSDILINRSSIPSTLGLSDVPPAPGKAPADVRANIGEAKSSGLEIALDYNHFFTNQIWLRVNATFTFAKSQYTKYEEIVPLGMNWLRNEGQYIGQHRGLIAERLFIDEADIANSPTQTFDNINPIGVMPGDIKYKDINSDGIINSHDVVPIGYTGVPQIESGFGFSFGAHGFDLSCFFRVAGRVSFMIDPSANVYSDGSVGTSPFIGNHALMKSWADDHWSETDRNLYAKWPRLSDTSRPNNEQASTWWLRDGSYLRLKSVEIGYTIPERITRKLGMKTLRVYGSGLNLLTFSKFKLWDVEMGGSGLNYPIQQVFNLGLNINF